MSIVVKGNHPLAEIIARKLFGINSVSNKERDAMVSRCVKEACCYVERLESDNERLRTHLAGLQKQIKDGELVPVKPIYDFIDSRRNAEDWTTLGMIKDWIKQFAAKRAKETQNENHRKTTHL